MPLTEIQPRFTKAEELAAARKIIITVDEMMSSGKRIPSDVRQITLIALRYVENPSYSFADYLNSIKIPPELARALGTAGLSLLIAIGGNISRAAADPISNTDSSEQSQSDNIVNSVPSETPIVGSELPSNNNTANSEQTTAGPAVTNWLSNYTVSEAQLAASKIPQSTQDPITDPNKPAMPDLAALLSVPNAASTSLDNTASPLGGQPETTSQQQTIKPIDGEGVVVIQSSAAPTQEQNPQTSSSDATGRQVPTTPEGMDRLIKSAAETAAKQARDDNSQSFKINTGNPLADMFASTAVIDQMNEVNQGTVDTLPEVGKLSEKSLKIIDGLGISEAKKDTLKEMLSAVRDSILRDGAKVNPEVVTAQAILESGWGGSGLTKKYNNYFGIKAGSKWTGESVNLPTKEFEGGKWITILQKFRAYSDPAESFADYAKMIENSSYFSDATKAENRDSVERYLHILVGRKTKYATDPLYATKIKHIIRENKINQVLDIEFSQRAKQPKAEKIEIDDRDGCPKNTERVEGITTGYNRKGKKIQLTLCAVDGTVDAFDSATKHWSDKRYKGTTAAGINKIAVAADAAASLRRATIAAKKDGVTLTASVGRRSLEEQCSIYLKNHKRPEQCEKWITAVPGNWSSPVVETSNHLSGRSVDFLGKSITWMENNGKKYGWYSDVAGDDPHFTYLG